MNSDFDLPKYTLRNHKNEICSLLTFKLPQWIDVPLLLSADVSGTLIVWDLTSRRPLISEHFGAQICYLQHISGPTIALLCKDHSMRILDITFDDRFGWSILERFKMPVNTLNFANIQVTQKREEGTHQIICCNTQDAETFDLYHFKLDDLHSLKRQCKAVNLFPILEKILREPKSHLNKMGLLMKFLHKDGIYYCGFESGYIVGIKHHNELIVRKKKTKKAPIEAHQTGEASGISRAFKSSEINQSQVLENHKNMIEIVYLSNVHYPEPILDMDIRGHKLLSTSANNKIGIHEHKNYDDHEYIDDGYTIVDNTFANNMLEVNSDNYVFFEGKNLNHIKMMHYNTIISSWNGKSFVVDDEDFRITSEFGKSRSIVYVTESAQGNIDRTNEIKNNTIVKIGAIEGIDKYDDNRKELILSGNSIINRNLGQMRRINNIITRSWCIIGYNDGTICMRDL